MSSIGKNSKPNNLISPIKLVNTNITKSSHSSYIPINDNNNDNWQIQNSKTSKRNISSSSDPSVSSPTSHTTKTKKRAKPPFITANRFQVLSPNDAEVFSFPEQTEKQTTTQEEISSKPPPPIFMRGITEYNRLCLEFSQLIGKENFYCKSSTDQLKIQTASPEAYRILVHYLKNNDALFHTFQLNQNKPIRAVIRNIHSSTTVDEIKKELTDLSFEVLQITQVLHKTTKLPLPLFFVNLPQSEKSSEIFKLTSLLYAKIKVEEPYKHRTIPQCLNCQDYGHTRAYCGYPARYVRCGAPHISSDCPKPRELPAKCALCAGDHPANYKGCTVFKELQRRKTPRSKSNFLHDNVNLNPDDNTDNVKMSHPLPPIHSKRRLCLSEFENPILFNIFVSDQPTLANTLVADYADDKAIMSIHENPEIASASLQLHLDLMADWYKKWRVKINSTKSVHITFTLKLGQCPNVFINNTPIPTSDVCLSSSSTSLLNTDCSSSSSEFREQPRKQCRTYIDKNFEKNRICSSGRTEEIHQALAKMIAINQMPLFFCSSSGFKQFMSTVESNYIICKEGAIKQRLKGLKSSAENLIKEELKDAKSVSCTSDCWSSIAQESYITVTAHFIDDQWCPKSYTLTTHKLEDRHTASNLSD
ncbi:hypothetical protein QTP88_001824 [Uroleucon formosanum]